MNNINVISGQIFIVSTLSIRDFKKKEQLALLIKVRERCQLVSHVDLEQYQMILLDRRLMS